MRAAILGVVLVVSGGSWACGSPVDPPGDVDGGGDGPSMDGGDDGPDASPLTAGLRLTFASDPALPGALGGDPFAANVDEMRVDLEDLRAVGDSATGENTTRAHLSLRWGEDDEEEDELRSGPEEEGDIEVLFPTASPGYYSLVKADITSYRVKGTVELGGGRSEFEIEDNPPTPLSITMSLDDLLLESDTIRTVAIRCSLHEVVGDVPWDSLDGGLEIHADDAAIAGVRVAMEGSFTAAVLDQIE